MHFYTYFFRPQISLCVPDLFHTHWGNYSKNVRNTFYVGQDQTGCQTWDVCVTGWKISTSIQVRNAFICDLKSTDTCVCEWFQQIQIVFLTKYKFTKWKRKIIILLIIMLKTECSHCSHLTVAVQRPGFHLQLTIWIIKMADTVHSVTFPLCRRSYLAWVSLEAARWQQLWFAHFIKNASVRRAP